MRCRRTAGAERTQSAGTAASRERTGKIVLGGFCPGSQKPCVVELCRGKAGRAGWGARHDYEGVGMSNKREEFRCVLLVRTKTDVSS